MENVSSAPWCVGSIFPAPQLLTEPSALPSGPLMFDRSDDPHCVLKTGFPMLYTFNERVEKPVVQAHDFLGNFKEAFLPEETLIENLQQDALLKTAMAQSSNYLLGNRLGGIQIREGMLQLFFPAGANCDSVGSCICVQKSDGMLRSKWCVCDGIEGTRPYSLSSSLRQPILQIAVAKNESCGNSGILEASIAVRTPYQVHWLTSRAEDDCMALGSKEVTAFEHTTSHVAWNPHLPGEAAIVLENGDVEIVDLKSEQSKRTLRFLRTDDSIGKGYSIYGDSSNYEHEKRKKRGKRLGLVEIDLSLFRKQWWCCEYAWHPQTLIVAGYKDICLVDLRNKIGISQPQSAIGRSTFASIDGGRGLASYCNQLWREDHFTAFTRAEYDGMYQFAAASTHHLLLFDIRQPHTPLLQWEHGMQHEPPGFLQMCSITDLYPRARGSLNMTLGAGRIILASAFKSGDIHAFLYGPQPLDLPKTLERHGHKRHCDDLGLNDTLYSWGLPSKLSVEKLDTGKSEHAFRKNNELWKTKQYTLPKTHHPENISGLFHFSSPILDASGFTMLQLTGSGSILAQKYEASTKLETSKHRQSQTISQPLARIEATAGKSQILHYIELMCIPAFLHYIQHGSVWPIYYESGFWLNMEGCQDAPIAHHHYFFTDAAGKFKDVSLQLIKQARNPLSIYEITNKVLWRILQGDLVQVAIETRHGTVWKGWKSYTGVELPDILPANDLMALNLDATDLQGVSMEKKGDSDNLIFLGPAVPLPVLLEIQQFTMQKNKSKLPSAQQNIGPVSKVNGRNGKLSGHCILSGGCSWLTQVIDGFRVEKLVPEETESVVSLSDSVDLWSDSSHSQRFLFHCAHLPLASTYSIDSSLPIYRTTELQGSKEKKQNAFENVEFHNFVGSKIYETEDGIDSGLLSELDVNICPISLPFRKSDRTLGSEELGMLTSLKDRFQQWQANFKPYASYAKSHVYKHA